MSKAAAPISHLHFARVTIQARTPISSASGEVESTHDMALVRDAGGLPRIQGSSVQGGLRSLYPTDAAEVDELFGFQRRNEGAAGRIIVSDGCLHGNDDKSVSGLKRAADIAKDDVLALLSKEDPLKRDHVRLDPRHVAHPQQRGKFERVAVPIGTRFSFELALWGEQGEADVLKSLLDLMADPRFRLGGATGRGYGAVDVVRAATWSADIRKTDVEMLRRVRASAFSEHLEPLESHSPKKSASPYWLEASLKLKPVGVWRVGQGASDTSRTVRQRVPAPKEVNVARDKEPDAVPLRERQISWKREPGVTRECAVVQEAKDSGYIVPGAGVKGVIAHRTLYHFNRLNKHWAASTDAVQEYAMLPPALVEIFGTLRSGTGGVDDGSAGRTFIDDTLVQVAGTTAVAFDHNSIDRFTGGVRNRILFSDEAVLGGEISLQIGLLPIRGASTYDPNAVKALRAAVEDLCQGRLALGAKSLGYCQGPLPTWSGPGATRQEQAA